MLLTSVNILVDSLRETDLLRRDQYQQLVDDLSTKIEDPQELARHIVKLGWISLYQAKKLLAGRGSDLVLGNYVIIDKLGEGGMGKVYKARQLRLSRTVALKVVRPNLIVNEMAIKRFLREAKAAAQLAHPNIVRLFDADQVGNRHYLAMEYVEGTDLANLVREQGQLPVAMASSFIRQAATGLQHAHDMNLVHRDIKPSNLLVSAPNKSGKYDSGGVVKILDMGLARITLQDDDAASALTQDGTVIGTPDFMSPEQAKNSSTVDGRSDLYSLGCSFYYLLTGQTPFPHGTTLEKLMQHQIDPPPKVQSLRPDIPDEVARIIHKLLAKNPGDRYGNGATLASALDPWSVFDGRNKLLTTSGKLRKPAVVPEALFVACTPLPPDIDPFNFEKDDAEPEPLPAATEPEPAPATKKSGSQPLPKKRKRWRLIAGSVFALLVSVGAILDAAGLFSPAPAATDDGVAIEEPRPREKPALPEIKKPDTRVIDFYLPVDTELVAVLNMQQLQGNKLFQEMVLPKAKDFVNIIKAGTGFDPFRAIEKVIVSVPAGNASQAVFILHGNDIASPAIVNWAGKLPGVTRVSEKFSGGTTRDVYALPGDKDPSSGNQEIVYAAVLSTSPGAIVLGVSRERVLEAVARSTRFTQASFADPTIKTALQKYPKEPVTLWIAAGNDSKLLDLVSVKRDRSKDGGINFIVAVLRLRDNNTMTFEMNVDAKSKPAADICYDHIRNLVNLIATAKPEDRRISRIAELIQTAKPSRVSPDVLRENPNIHQWWCSISSDALPEWFAPFVGN